MGDGVPGVAGTFGWAPATPIFVLGLNGLAFTGPFIVAAVFGK